jgi:hypothetical protein
MNRSKRVPRVQVRAHVTVVTLAAEARSAGERTVSSGGIFIPSEAPFASSSRGRVGCGAPLEDTREAMKRTALCLALVLLAPGLSLFAGAGFQVIANPSVVGDQLSRQVLAGIFLKKNSRWGDGHEIVVVDQSTQSPVRAEFTRAVLQQPLPAVQAYWLRAISSGATPPVVRGSDRDVAEFVRTHDGAIGYVAADFAAEGVKVVRIIE